MMVTTSLRRLIIFLMKKDSFFRFFLMKNGFFFVVFLTKKPIQLFMFFNLLRISETGPVDGEGVVGEGVVGERVVGGAVVDTSSVLFKKADYTVM